MGFVWDSLATDLTPSSPSVVDVVFGAPAGAHPLAATRSASMPNPNVAPATVDQLRVEHARLAQQMRKARDDWDAAYNAYREMNAEWRRARDLPWVKLLWGEGRPDNLRAAARRANLLMDSWVTIKSAENRAYAALRDAANPGVPPSPRREQPMVYVPAGNEEDPW